MKRISVNFSNCYGIKKLNYIFDFSNNTTYALYAPNGVMKTSFAKTFQDISSGSDTVDRVFTSRQTLRTVNDENGDALKRDQVFVVEPYNESYKSDQISTLLVNRELKLEYDEINRGINEKKDRLLKNVKSLAQISADPEPLISVSITHESNNIFTALKRIKSDIEENKYPELAKISYGILFNDKVVDMLRDRAFLTQLSSYITRYDKLISSSTFFCKGIFNHNNASSIAKNLEDSGFFKANHSVFVTIGGEKTEINNEADLIAAIKHEKDVIMNSPDLLNAFELIDKKLDKNKDLREFREYLERNKDLIPELENIESLRQKLWISYLAASQELYNDLMSDYEQGDKRREEIIIQAKGESTQWRDVIKIFNERFFVPFKVSMDNQVRVILNNDVPRLKFEFQDESSGVSADIEEKDLLRVLSNGERRALYILNIIFEVQARKSAMLPTLFIVDDIADSFDYKNKYAIIEYLNEIKDIEYFRQIILTHNFDFYRTIAGRLHLPRNHHVHTIKSSDEVSIVEEHYQKNPFEEWKRHLHNNSNMLVASIPFIRNLAEYCGYSSEYNELTSLLHIQDNTDMIKIKGLEDICKIVLVDKYELSLPNPEQKVIDLVFDLAQKIVDERSENIDLEKKIVLSMAIRLKSEIFLIGKINDSEFVTSITSNQTIKLIKKYSSLFPTEVENIRLFHQVNLMTPENIHLNSFMYEPILDMAIDHLKQLFNKVTAL